MKKRMALLLSLVMILSLAGCGNGTQESESTGSGTTAEAGQGGESQAASEDPFILSMMVPQTGFPSAAKAYQNGVTIAVDEINAAGGVLGRQLEVVVEDMGTTADVALNAFNIIASRDNSSVILGCALSASALTVESQLEEEEIIMISGATSPMLSDIENPYFFRGRTSDEYMTRIAMTYITEDLGITSGNIGMLYDSTDFGVGAFGVVEELCAEQNLTLVSEAFNADDTDVSAQVMQLKQSDIDVLIVWTSSGFPVASRAIYEQGLECPIVASAAVANASVLTTCTDWIEGWYTVTDVCLDAPIDGLEEFVEKHNEQFDASELSFDALTTYSWVYLLKDAIERAGSFDTQAIIDALNETSGFQGLNGVYTKFGNIEFLNNATIGQISEGVVHYIDQVEAPIEE